MEHNLSKIIAIRCYKKVEYDWYEVLEKGTYWWRFLGIIPIFKYTREEDMYRQSFMLSDDWVTKEKFIESFSEDFWKEHYIDTDGLIYSKPFITIWIDGDSHVGNRHSASFTKHFNNVDEMQDYKDKLIADCESKGIYLKQL